MVVRHASTPKHIYDTWFGHNPVHVEAKDSLIVLAWVKIDPKIIREELNDTMILLGINPKTFKIKCLSPIYEELVPIYSNSKPEMCADEPAFDFFKEMSTRIKE